jgi:ribosomal protein S18 acetylase RimI-like enzyme
MNLPEIRTLTSLPPGTIVELLDDRAISLMSWDPRGAPEQVEIGHNCIVPEFQGVGLGSAQLRETLERLAARSVRRVRATTGEHPFLAPAQRMYRSCGFREVGRRRRDAADRFRTIEYRWISSERSS